MITVGLWVAIAFLVCFSIYAAGELIDSQDSTRRGWMLLLLLWSVCSAAAVVAAGTKLSQSQATQGEVQKP